MNVNIKKSSTKKLYDEASYSHTDSQSLSKEYQESSLNIQDLVVRNENATYYVEALQSRPSYGIDI